MPRRSSGSPISPVTQDTRGSESESGAVTSTSTSRSIVRSRPSLSSRVPRCSSRRARREPRNPAPPVTTILIAEHLTASCALSGYMPCSTREERSSAVDAEHLAVDELRRGSAEEGDRVGLVAGCAVAFEGSLLHQHPGIDRARLQEAAGGGGAGADAVDPDVVWAGFKGEASC